MQAALRLKTTVLPGNRIEIIAPELKEGETVDVLILLPEQPANQPETTTPKRHGSMLEFLASLPDRNHTPEEWEAIERELREEKDSWER